MLRLGVASGARRFWNGLGSSDRPRVRDRWKNMDTNLQTYSSRGYFISNDYRCFVVNEEPVTRDKVGVAHG